MIQHGAATMPGPDGSAGEQKQARYRADGASPFRPTANFMVDHDWNRSTDHCVATIHSTTKARSARRIHEGNAQKFMN
jgi:hypothetical protein